VTDTKSKIEEPDSDYIQEISTSFNLEIDHIQIDNVINDVIPVFFSPSKELIKYEENQDPKVSDLSYTPFIQIKIDQIEI
jgi:hypothetical protein